jgi:hypothetical protein
MTEMRRWINLLTGIVEGAIGRRPQRAQLRRPSLQFNSNNAMYAA